ncbi:MAG: hypothetical protein GX217_08670 [Clostridiaceae bacterium]|nr:hypothetical protein [Clostridiaceae bacterium]
MDIFELVKQVSQMKIADAFSELKSQAEFLLYSQSEAPYFLQPEGKIYTIYEHDFSFSSGDVITYTAKVGEPAAANGNWDVFYCVEDDWYRYKNQKFILHRTSRNEIPSISYDEVSKMKRDIIPAEDADVFQ